MVSQDFAPAGRIEFGQILSLSFRLVRLDWLRLALLAALFLWAPYELYSIAYDAAYSHDALLGGVGGKLMILAGYLVLLAIYNVGFALALKGLLRRLGGEGGGPGAWLAAAGAGAVLSIVGNAPTLITLFTGSPTTWGAYGLMILGDSAMLFALNLVFGSAMAVSLVEGKGAGRAILRAAQLSRGARLSLAPLFLAWQLTFVVGYVLLLAVGAAVAGGLAAHLGHLWIALTSLPMIAMTALVYRELRRIKEGLTEAEISGVFG